MNEWWRGGVIYQVYPRSFADSDNDGVGDLPGVTARMDYLHDLGVDGVWLSPFFTSPMRDFGYDISDYTGVDPTFDTIEDFDALVTKAHSFDLKLVMAMVRSLKASSVLAASLSTWKVAMDCRITVPTLLSRMA